jgi:hypothetical protein
MAAWMLTLEDQDAIVEVVCHRSDGGYYQQGGWADTEEFDPEQHVRYTDLGGNQFVLPSSPYYNQRSVVLGVING